jgi:delta8-fatty-acid desaturase
MTLSTVKKRVSSGEILVIINQKVYNLTKWVAFHPGGELAIKHMAGQDCTDAMIVLHPSWVMDKIHSYYIADLDQVGPVSPISQDFKLLEKELHTLGLYESHPRFWIQENAKFLLLWLGMLYFVIYGSSNVEYLAAAMMAATLWHQAAFVAHDAGHSGITHVRKYDTLYGIFLADFFGGLSIGWWKHSHYVHHIITNHVEHDPDIQHLPFFAVSSKFAENVYSTFHERVLYFDKFAQMLIPHQHRLYYVVLAFGRFNLYVQSWMHVLFRKNVYYRSLEIVGMLSFWVWFGAMLSYLPTWKHVLGFILVSHCVTMFLHLQITLSHFGMSTEEVEGEGFVERQLRTSMDVECPAWLDWFHGGLQVRGID